MRHRGVPWRVLAVALCAVGATVFLLVSAFGWPDLAPASADSPCQYTEDERCIPPPLTLGQSLLVEEGASSAPKGPGVLVKRKAYFPAGSFRERLQAEGFADVEGLLNPNWWRVNLAPGQTPGEVMSRLQSQPEVEAVEEDRIVQLMVTPDDPLFYLQWGMSKVQAPDAWDATGGSRDVWIAIVDSGIDKLHPDRPPYLLLGYDFVNGDFSPADDAGHGTHVAGIAGAAPNNQTGIAGLCPFCEILVIKVMSDEGLGWVSDLADGIRYAAYWGTHYGKRTIINLSLGGEHSEIEAEAVSYAQRVGALVVAAAGNDGPGAPSCPAGLPGVLAVSATDPLDGPASFSQYGDIGAPGVDIPSTVPRWFGANPYAWGDGTSMASPFVAGAASLVWSTFPSYSAGQVAAKLLESVDAPTGWNSSYGAGRLNARRAVEVPTQVPLPTIPDSADRAFLPLMLRSYYSGPTPAPSGTIVSAPTRMPDLPQTPFQTETPKPTSTPWLTWTPKPTSTATATSTPTPTPTSMPTATGTATSVPTRTPSETLTPDTVRVRSCRTYSSYSILYVAGEVVNDMSLPVYSVKVQGVFYDSAGEVVASRFTYAYLTRTAPGQRNPFKLSVLSGAELIDSFELALSWRESSILDYDDIAVVSQDTRDYYGVEVYGEVRNDHEREMRGVEVAVTFYDAAGEVVDVDRAYASVTALTPGAISSYSVKTFDEDLTFDSLGVRAEGYAAP